MCRKNNSIIQSKNDKIVKYDNSFNKTNLNVLTEVQADILMAVLEKMGEEVEVDKDNKKCYVARYEFKEIRNLIDSKNMQAVRIKKVFDALLKTQVEIFEKGVYTKANLFSSYSLTDKATAEIVLSSELTKKMTAGESNYTILQLEEYVQLKNKYSKELYRLLRQFRHTGLLITKKEDLIKFMKPPKTYNENYFIKRILLPAMEEVSIFFEDLKLIGYKKGENSLPEICKFKFKKHQRAKVKDIIEGTSSKEEKELLEYIMNNGGI